MKAKPSVLITDSIRLHRENHHPDPNIILAPPGDFIRFHRENHHPSSCIILSITADEEGGKSNGVDWLLKNHRDLIDAAFVLNADAGGLTTMKGKAVNVDVEASEK